MFICEKYQRIFLLLTTILCFVPFLGAVHLFDWDEINFAESAREMIVGHDYWHVKIGFQDFHEKPPLFIWMQVLCMKFLGVNELAARLPNAICGIVTIQVVYSIGKKIHQAKFAWWWALAYLCSILPHLYFKSGIIDPWFNLFIFSSFYGLFEFYATKKLNILFFGGLLLGLALLSKGPVAALVIGLCIFVIILKNYVSKIKQQGLRDIEWPISFKHLLIYFLISVLPFSIWYALDMITHGPQLFLDFINYQVRLLKTEDAGHGGFPGYHVVVLLFGCFPASIFAMHSLGRKQNENEFHAWMKILFWVVLILFSLVQSKIVHYSSLCYFPLTYCAAVGIQEMIVGKKVLSYIQRFFLSFTLILFSSVILSFPFILKQVTWMQQLLHKDPFAVGNLNAVIHWSGFEILPGLCLAIGSCFAIYFFRQKKMGSMITAIFISSLLLVQGILFFYVKNIEGYSQRAAIVFFKSLKGKDVYVNSFNYKSYAPYFYADVHPALFPKNNISGDNLYLLNSIHSPVYLSAKVTSKHDEALRNFTLLYEKNGFCFFIKNP